MKKLLPAIALSLALLLAGCSGTNQNTDANEESKENTVNTVSEENADMTDGETEDNSTDGEKTEDGDEENEVSDTDKEITKDELYNMMASSDYIGRVKLTRLGDNDTELKVLENYKGSLSNIEFPVPKGLKTDREYLLFYKDDEEGNITPTNGNRSFIEVAPTNDTVLDYVEEIYDKKEEDNSDSNNSKSSNASGTSDEISA